MPLNDSKQPSSRIIQAATDSSELPAFAGSKHKLRRCKTRSPSAQQKEQSQLTMQSISAMIDQIKRCESILSGGIADDQQQQKQQQLQQEQQQQQLSDRLLSKVNRLNSLCHGRASRKNRQGRPASHVGLDRNNNKCCNGATSSNAVVTDAMLNGEQTMNSHSEEGAGAIEGQVVSGEGSASGTAAEGEGSQNVFPKHQDYCLCHKRKCQRCGCLCPCSEHACPSCGYTSRVVMTMRAVDGLKVIANAQKARFRNGRMANVGKCKQKRKRFLMNENGNECSHAVMVRVGGGFVPLVEYLKSHNKVVLSKFTRGDGSAFLSPWRPYYPGPLKKGRPRGIRYVDSVTQQLEEIIFANREAGKTTCVCP